MFTVRIDERARLHAGAEGALLVAGQPLRVLRLNAAAAGVAARWRHAAQPVGPGERRLAERLHRSGAAELRFTVAPHLPAEVTVVVPVRDRPAALDRVLASVGPCGRMLVVDDASRDPAGIAEVAARHGAHLVVRTSNGGPAAARNTGLRCADGELVAFVDSDCVLPGGWLADLLPMLLPDVAVVAPRVVGAGGRGWLRRFEIASGPLDLGSRPGPVRPGAPIGHVPAAALLCRRSAFDGGFDEQLRLGEDVDLVWRLAAAGWQVRYCPNVVVRHETRPGLLAWTAQRVGYGSSAAALEERHPGQLPPVVISRWMLPALAGLALRRPVLTAGWTVLVALALRHRLPPGRGRTAEAARLSAEGLAGTVLGLCEAAARPWLPALAVVSLLHPPVRRAAAAVIAMRLLRQRGTCPGDVPVAMWAALRVADDLAYAAGLWSGAARRRRPAVLLPRLG